MRNFITHAINSCLNQSYSNIEIIVIDDGSTDGSNDILEHTAGINLVKQTNKGACVAHNRGIFESKGRFIKFLDADDILSPDCISLQIEEAAVNDQINIIYGYSEAFHHDYDTETIKRIHVPDRDQLIDLMLRNILISLPLYPIDALRAVNGFNARLHARQEWDLNIRLSIAGYKFVYRDCLTFRQRYHNSSDRIGNRKLNLDKELMALNFTYEILKSTNNTEVKKAWGAVIWELGRHFIRRGDLHNSRRCFQIAKNISPDGYSKYFGTNYRTMNNIFGALLTEILSLALSRIKKFKNFYSLIISKSSL